MKKLLAIVVLLAVVVGVVLYLPGGGGPALANAATLAVLHGDVDAQKGGAPDFGPALDGDLLASGDVVRANQAGLAVLTFFEGSTISVEPGSQVKVTSLAHTAGDGIQVSLEVTLGTIWAAVTPFKTPDSRFEVKTPSTTAAVRGTAFVVRVAVDGTTTILTTEGQVLVQAQGQSQTVGPNQQNTTPPGGPPGQPSTQPPRPKLRLLSQVNGLGFTVIDKAGRTCGATGGSAVRQILGCNVVLGGSGPGSEQVDFAPDFDDAPGPGGTRVLAAGYDILMTSSGPVPNIELVASGGLDLAAPNFTVKLSDLLAARRETVALAQGDLARTIFSVTRTGDRLSADGFGAVDRILNTCGGQVRGRVFQGNDVDGPLGQLQQFAAQNRNQPAVLILTNRALIDYARAQAAQFRGPPTLSGIEVAVDNAGIHASANVSMGLSFRPTADIVAGARAGKLLLSVGGIQGVPGPLVPQLRSTLNQQLANVDFPLNVQRVMFRPSCLAIIGTTK